MEGHQRRRPADVPQRVLPQGPAQVAPKGEPILGIPTYCKVALFFYLVLSSSAGTVGRSVGWSVDRSVFWSVGRFFASSDQSVNGSLFAFALRVVSRVVL